MKNLSYPHSPIIYSTGISPTIKRFYTIWKRSEDLKDENIIRNRLFLQFIESCEIEDKYYINVINKLEDEKTDF